MREPKRFADGGGSEELRELLAAAEHDVLEDRRVGRVQAALLLSVAASGSIGGATSATSAKAGATALGINGSKWLLLSALLIAAGTGAGLLLTMRSTTAPSSAASAKGAAPAEPAATSTSNASDPPPEVAAPVTSVSSSRAAPLAPPPRVTNQPVASAPASSAAPSPREGLLLLQARHALGTDPARTLELVRQHEREFPNSQLAPERATLRAEAESRSRQ